MPRIYAKNERYSGAWAPLPFVAGVAAVPKGTPIPYFDVSARGYTVDNNRHALEVWDKLPSYDLDALIAYMGGTVSAGDDKQARVRKLEALLSAKLLGALTVASAAATEGAGKTKLTITQPGTAQYRFRSGASASPDILFGDTPDETWTALTLTEGVADEIAPTSEADAKYTVARLDASGKVDAIAKGDLTLKAAQ